MRNTSWFVSLVAAIGGLLFGYNTGIISGALGFLTTDFALTTLQQALVVSTLLIGAMVGAFAGGLIADKIGRKKALFLTVIFFLLGALTTGSATGFETLLIGRFITGIACGIASTVVPLYISEMSPAKHRGALVAINQLMITVGILLAYVMQYLFAEHNEWRGMFYFAIIPLTLQFLALFLITETPSWLLQNRKKEAADKIFDRFGITPEVREIGAKPSWQELFDPDMRKIFFVGVGITIFQQLTGVNAIFYFTPKIFQETGTHTAESAIFATIFIGVVNVIFTALSLWLIDKLGRRFLLLLGLSGIVLSLFILGCSIEVLTIPALFCYVAFFAVSIGPIAWLIPSEIFPLHIRSTAMGAVIFVNWACNYLVSLTFLSLIDTIGAGFTFWVYMVVGLLGIWFVWKKVPETKGKSLEQIQHFWHKK